MNILGNMVKGIWNNVEKDVWKYKFFDKANMCVCVCVCVCTHNIIGYDIMKYDWETCMHIMNNIIYIMENELHK